MWTAHFKKTFRLASNCLPVFALLLFASAFSSAGEVYNWKPVVIKGGGFVSGIITHPNAPGVVYSRTDIGGAYRWDPADSSWIPLLDFATNNNIHGIESVAIDPSDSNRVYIAAGRGTGVFLASTNQGASFTMYSTPFALDGNADGRSNGERLAVDPNSNNILFYGTRNSRLYKSTNFGVSWNQITFPVTSTPNNLGLVFVQFVEGSGPPGNATPDIYVGASRTGGTNLFRSTDAGVTWTNVPTVAPTSQLPHHAAQDGLGNMYVTFNDNQGPNNVTAGSVIKLNLATLTSANVTPPKNGGSPEQGGFAGVSVDRQNPTTLVVSTIDRWYPPPYDQVLRSTNGGLTWKTNNTLPGNAPAPWTIARTPHWAGDVEVDPFNSDRAWFITGYGVFSTTNLTAYDSGGTPTWAFTSDGIEEFFTFCVVSPPSGSAQLFSAHGDQGAFRHTNPDVSPPASDYFSHRVNSFNIDFAENNPNQMVRLFEDSPFGGYSLNGGVTWTDFTTSPPGANGIQPPSNIAISANGGRIVWMPRNAIAYYSTNRGVNWTATTGGPSGTLVPISDRVNSNKFYIYTAGSSRLYFSTNGGAAFNQGAAISSGLTPRCVFSNEGHLWLPRSSAGLSRSTDSGVTFSTVASVTRATLVGFGKAAPGQSYPAIFITGRVTNVDGIFRSDDEGASWVRLNDNQHQFTFANIRTLCGDPRVYGRVYIGTEGRGIVYGDLQAPPEPPAAPGSLTAAPGDGEVDLNWTASSGATNYFLQRSLVGGGPYTPIVTNASLAYTDTGLNNGTRYYYVVSAASATGVSTNSIEASAQPVSLTPIDMSFSVTDNQLQLSWPPDHKGWRLEMQINAPGEGLISDWVPVTDSGLTNQITFPVDALSGSVFFRLVYP